MEEDAIGVVLARACELRSKITNCISIATTGKPQKASLSENEREETEEPADASGSPSPEQDGEAEEEEAEALLIIRDALDSLEAQLSSLQTLQQQQRYEREAALAEIDYSRKILLAKLKEYKGQDLEVIQETSAFASETVEHGNDLLLPPYPSDPPQSLMLDKGFLSLFPTSHDFVEHRTISDVPNGVAKKAELVNDGVQAQRKHSLLRIGHFVTSVAKTAITLVGLVSILNVAGFEPWLKKMETHFKVSGFLLQPATEERRLTTECPPGKVLAVEDGEARCVVKERVEIPFESHIGKPDVNCGFG